MKILDARLRPPYKSFQDGFLYTGYNTEGYQSLRKIMGLTESVTAKSRSMDAMISEMDMFEVQYGVVCTRVTDGGSNQDLLEVLEKWPGRFIGMPHIEPADGKDAIAEIERLVINGPCTGIYLEPGFRMEKIVMHADDPRIDPIWDICQSKDIPIILQYGGGKNTVEFYTPTDIDHVMAKFPKLKIMISHGGWPQVMAFIHQAFKHPGVFLSPDLYFEGYPGSADFIVAANGILQDKIIYGSAFPLCSLESGIAMYERNLKDDVFPKIMWKNGAAFFKVEK